MEAQFKKEKGQLESSSTAVTVLTTSTNQINKPSNLSKKQEDQIQRELFSENRKKALQRIREYKMVNSSFDLDLRWFYVFINKYVFMVFRKLRMDFLRPNL